jgi:hypothetical protein
MLRSTSPGIELSVEEFTDRDHGKGFVLSALRMASRAGEGKHIIPYGIHTARDGCMEGELLGMCQNITHV